LELNKSNFDSEKNKVGIRKMEDVQEVNDEADYEESIDKNIEHIEEFSNSNKNSNKNKAKKFRSLDPS